MPLSAKAFILLFDLGVYSDLVDDQEELKKEVFKMKTKHIELDNIDGEDLFHKVVASIIWFNIQTKPELQRKRYLAGVKVRQAFKKLDEVRLKRAEKLVFDNFSEHVTDIPELKEKPVAA